MVGTILAGDQAGELGQHPGQSRSGDRHRGCRGVGRGGCERHAAHLRWLPRRTCPGASANRQDLLEQSCGRPGLGDRPRIRHGEAVPGRQSVRDPRPVPVQPSLSRRRHTRPHCHPRPSVALAVSSPEPSPSPSSSPERPTRRQARPSRRIRPRPRRSPTPSTSPSPSTVRLRPRHPRRRRLDANGPDVGRELRITGRAYIRNFMALFESIEREQARRCDPLADRPCAAN